VVNQNVVLLEAVFLKHFRVWVGKDWVFLHDKSSEVSYQVSYCDTSSPTMLSDFAPFLFMDEGCYFKDAVDVKVALKTALQEGHM
jgi:hypothetical protein